MKAGPTWITAANLVTLSLAACVTTAALASPTQLRADGVVCDFAHYVDATNAVPASTVLSTQDFAPLDVNNAGFGFDPATHWLKVTCRSETKQAADRMLEIQYPLIDHVDAYRVDASSSNLSLTLLTRAGDQDDWSERAIKHRNAVVPVSVPTTGQSTYLIRSQTDGSIQFPMRLWKPDVLNASNQEEYLALGLYYGILGALLVYNLFLLVSMRERVFAYYVLYVGSFMLLQFSLNGLLIQFLFERSYFLANNGIGMLMPMIQGFILLFSVEYLKLKDSHRRLGNLTSWAGWALCLTAPLMLALPYRVTSQTGALFALFVPAYVIVLGILRVVRGYYPARFFLTAWVIYLVGIVLLAAKNMGLIAPGFVANYSIQIGSAVEVILLSLGLGYRIKSVETEKTAIQARADTLSSLARATQVLAHDVRKPFRMLTMVLRDLQQPHAPATKRVATEKLVVVESAMAAVNGMIDDILDADHGLRLHQKPVDVEAMVERNLKVAAQIHDLTGITLRCDYSHKVAVLADERRIDRVLQNIIGNAVEAMNGRGELLVSTKSKQRLVEISVWNSNSYIPSRAMPLIFEPFFSEQKERGTGLGLSIAKRIVDSHGGSIWCRSSRATGTTFSFTLPVSPLAAIAGIKSVSELRTDGVGVLVEDDPFVCDAWRKAKTQDGLEIVTFRSPKDFWTYVRAGKLSLHRVAWLVTDFHFGDVDATSGNDFAAAVRRVAPQLNIYMATDDSLAAVDHSLFVAVVDKDPVRGLSQIGSRQTP